MFRPLATLLVLGAFAVAVLTWLKVAQTLNDIPQPTRNAQPSAVVWAGRVFKTPSELGRWLRSHGSDYRTWARRHPLDASALERRPAPAPARRRQPKEASAAKPKPPAAAPKATAPAASRTTTTTHLVRVAALAILLLAALACACAALLPVPLRRRYPELTERIWPHRDLFGAGAAALLLGIAIGMMLN